MSDKCYLCHAEGRLLLRKDDGYYFTVCQECGAEDILACPNGVSWCDPKDNKRCDDCNADAIDAAMARMEDR